MKTKLSSKRLALILSLFFSMTSHGYNENDAIKCTLLKRVEGSLTPPTREEHSFTLEKTFRVTGGGKVINIYGGQIIVSAMTDQGRLNLNISYKTKGYHGYRHISGVVPLELIPKEKSSYFWPVLNHYVKTHQAERLVLTLGCIFTN